MLPFLLHALFAVSPLVVAGEIMNVGEKNFTEFTTRAEMVLVLFHSVNCPHSKHFLPVLQELDSLMEQDAHLKKKTLIGLVDCEKEINLCREKRVIKVPTLRLYDLGVERKEYRKGRNARALLSYMKDFTAPYVTELAPGQGRLIRATEQAVIYFNPGGVASSSPTYEEYKKSAHRLRELCNFYTVQQEDVIDVLKNVAPNSILFKPHRYEIEESHAIYKSKDGSLFDWIVEHCNPLVEEMTFDNAEEILEADAPILVLFHKEGDRSSIELFKKRVEEELRYLHEYMNFATCDGELFRLPLIHLDKGMEDLPLIVLDSMEHMFPFPDFRLLQTNGSLKTFANAYFSDELHDLYHKGNVGKLFPQLDDVSQVTSPPRQSVFTLLQPSDQRYSLIHDEF